MEAIYDLYDKEKRIAALAEENRQIQRRFEHQQRENAKAMQRLQIEAAATSAKLEETRRESKQKELDNQRQLQMVTQRLEKARAEDKAAFEREAAR